MLYVNLCVAKYSDSAPFLYFIDEATTAYDSTTANGTTAHTSKPAPSFTIAA